MPYVICVECSASVAEDLIDKHVRSGCKTGVDTKPNTPKSKPAPSQAKPSAHKENSSSLAPIFKSKRTASSPPPPQTDGPERDNEPPTPTPKRAKTSKQHLTDAAPLAERMRPKSLDELVGQEHLVGKGSLLRWGPPGSGKTTIARMLASHTDATFTELSATSSGTADVRAIFEAAKAGLKLSGRRTMLFMDEIQRFNKAQQDIFLPYVENGWIQLVGATTENPSFKLNGALLSRCRRTNRNYPKASTLPARAYNTTCNITPNPKFSPKLIHSTAASPDPNETSTITWPSHPQATPRILASISSLAAGDARTALSLLELVLSAPLTIDEEKLLESLRRSVSSRYDRSGDDRYDMISALHKSIRGSDGSAAMYWLARMLTAGEDPLYIARRLIVVASEDVGLADNSALPLAIATYSACQTIGMPECRINLAHCVAFLAEAPKSTRSYEAYKKAEEAAQDSTIPVPMNIRNAPTGLMKELGYGEGYLYNPAFAYASCAQRIPPDRVSRPCVPPPAGDTSEKIWDERLLMKWEMRGNGGKEWEGRKLQSREGKPSEQAEMKYEWSC
ncbi:P-loop containing nucleoside triphosphate hydrolase protein [Rhizoctonia solani]|uniref:P-loop containing nucleoside triphosphate hydrolase protein n=1 Tax=Rhizoctonia solani TaxID=456999 RepID=A0A8H7M1B3_9AGAM|nr:P-loop containing nucleoside triphosphate hydrolase protein [Rhizoctonia solani]